MRVVKKVLCGIALAHMANGFSLVPGQVGSSLSSSTGFSLSPPSPLRRTTRTCSVKMMAKKGKKTSSSGASKGGFAKNVKGNEASSGAAPAPGVQEDVKASKPQSSKSVEATKSSPRSSPAPSSPRPPSPAAIVRREEPLDEKVLQEAQGILEANKKDLLGGMGNLPPKTFQTPDGSYRSLPENYLYG
ncbi:hypothetical protein GUITHDRAFT_154703, partial [Guillardia theta CCMP2712]